MLNLKILKNLLHCIGVLREVGFCVNLEGQAQNDPLNPDKNGEIQLPSYSSAIACLNACQVHEDATGCNFVPKQDAVTAVTGNDGTDGSPVVEAVAAQDAVSLSCAYYTMELGAGNEVSRNGACYLIDAGKI